jgi:integrase
MAKKGRPANYLRHPVTGNPVVGLARCNDGRYRVITTGDKFTASSDAVAIERFLRLKTATPQVDEALQADGSYFFASELELWQWVTSKIKETPKLIAAKTGIEEIGYLSNLSKPTDITIEEIIKCYEENTAVTKSVKALAVAATKTLFKEVNASTLGSLNIPAIQEYRAKTVKKYSAATCAQYFARPKQVISFCKKLGLDAKIINEALGKLATLYPPANKQTLEPKPITPVEFWKIYNVANDFWKALMLMALNSCMYKSEALATKWDEISQDTESYGYFVTNRAKTNVPRCSILWVQTLEAFDKLPHKPVYVFTSKHGSKFNAKSLWKSWDKLTKAADCDDVTFNQIRDAAYTAAIEGAKDMQAATVLAGHRFDGQKDNYVKRNPQLVKSAVDAIFRAFEVSDNVRLAPASNNTSW